MHFSPDQRLILALDLQTTTEAKKLAEKLNSLISIYKIGLSLIPIGGFDLVSDLKDAGKKIFLDLKLFDISNTIENTVKHINQLDVDFLTVHGDPAVVRAAVNGRKNDKTKILAITILTSLNRKDLDESLFKNGSLKSIVLERAQLALEAGADGVVASPHEAKLLRNLPIAKNKIIVTPGIRPEGISKNDQKRTLSPRSAIKNGADFIVIGRPIHRSLDPIKTVKSILNSIKEIS